MWEGQKQLLCVTLKTTLFSVDMRQWSHNANTHSSTYRSSSICNWQLGVYRRSLLVTCRLLDATFDASSVLMKLHYLGDWRRGTPIGRDSRVLAEIEERRRRVVCPIDKRRFNFLPTTRMPLTFDVIIMLPPTADCTIDSSLVADIVLSVFDSNRLLLNMLSVLKVLIPSSTGV